MIAILCATLAGVTIVLSRSVNGYLSQKVGPYLSTFFNYFTGFIASFVLCVAMILLGYQNFDFQGNPNITMLIGGVIGVFNILILNIVVSRVSAVVLTLLAFVGQLASGMILDYFIYGIFSMNKIVGCLIVFIGLVMYQYSDKERSN